MVPEINPNSIIPLYKQVLKAITLKVKSNDLKPGDRLPSEADLMKEYNVSRITVRTAIAELVDEGMLERSPGKGTFVAMPKSLYKADDHIGFSRSCILEGKTPTTKLLSAEMVYPAQQYIDYFGISEIEKIVRTKRLRLVDGSPTMIETNYYPSYFSFLLNENLEGSLFDLLKNKYNISVARSIRTLEVCFPTEEEVFLLNINSDTPLLLFTDKQKDAAGKPLFISKQVYCTERLKFYL